MEAHPCYISSSSHWLGGLLDRFWFHPTAVVLDQLNQGIARFLVRNATLDELLAYIKIDLSRSSTHITKVCIRHLSRSIDNATHDGYGHAWQMAGS